MGVQDVVNQVSYSSQTAFRAKTLAPYKVNGKEGGQFKTEGNLSFLRVYDAGHEVMYYRTCFDARCRDRLLMVLQSPSLRSRRSCRL